MKLKVGVVDHLLFCRRKGAASRCRRSDARRRRALGAQGGDHVLKAYPCDKRGTSAEDSMWFGAKRMFDRAGFVEVARLSAGARKCA